MTALLLLLACTGTPESPADSLADSPIADSPVETDAPPAPESSPEDYLREPPDGFVDLRTIDGLKVDIRYHTADNFTEAPLPGYGAPGAWMLEEPAGALARVHADLQADGMGLLVYDAYRPLRGTLGMVAWAERTKQVNLLDDGYIARRSGHNHGHTVDLTVYSVETGEPIDMGTPWDTLSEKSHTMNAEGTVLENRMILKNAMEKHGFRYYPKEWWHFRYGIKGTEARDVPYGCFEADEGAWEPPEGWNVPGFAMPMTWEPEPCDAEVGLTPPIPSDAMVQQIQAQAVLDFPRVKTYLHTEIPENLPLKVSVVPQLAKGAPSLTAGGQAVELVPEPEARFRFTGFEDLDGPRVKLTFTVPAEGMEGYAVLELSDFVWTVVDAQIVET